MGHLSVSRLWRESLRRRRPWRSLELYSLLFRAPMPFDVVLIPVLRLLALIANVKEILLCRIGDMPARSSACCLPTCPIYGGYLFSGLGSEVRANPRSDIHYCLLEHPTISLGSSVPQSYISNARHLEPIAPDTSAIPQVPSLPLQRGDTWEMASCRKSGWPRSTTTRSM
jgi:hypothetical protein